MRIVIDMQGTQTESRFRGIGRYTTSFGKAVVRNRDEHEIILALSGLLPDTIEPIRAAFDGLLPQDNIRVWHAPGPVKDIHPANESRREVAELIREAFLASLQPDVIHISSLFEGYLDDAVTSIGCFDKQTPVSVSLYDLIPLLNPNHYLKSPPYAKHYQRKVGYLKRATRCLAISDFSRQEGVEHLDVPVNRMVNVSIAVEPGFQPLPIDTDIAAQLRRKFGLTRTFILYTGGADDRKNLPRLIQAYAFLPTTIREDHQLLFAGKMLEGDIARLRRQAKGLGLKNDELCFTGYVSDEELIQLYNLCYLFVFPSWHEGFGLPALEAMACGAPVIGANTSSLPEVIGLYEALFDPFDVKAIAAKMTQALQDGGLRTQMRSHGLQQAKRFSWDETAQRAIAVWLELLKVQAPQTSTKPQAGHKPRLAFVSPLPPERSGIADYSIAVLPALSAHYDIELIVAQKKVDDPWVTLHGKVRDVAWLRAHAGEIDRVVYQFGNSSFHQHMLLLLEGIPGTVVLHDFYTSGLMAWLELHGDMANAWTGALYESHGYGAVRDRYRDAEAAKYRYPANGRILRHAQGVIVHSEYSRNLARQWYGNEAAAGWEVIPLVRTPVEEIDRRAAREQLDIDAADFVVCSFGILDATKLNHRLLQAWLESALAGDRRCRLIFVGDACNGDYGASLLKTMRESGLGDRVCMTGFVAPEVYRQYLAIADFAVQLRTNSRGETSAAIMDCMNHALPVIANAHGSIVELDREALWMLPDQFTEAELIGALERLRHSPELRARLGQRGRMVIEERHSPAQCSRLYAEAIESFYARPENCVRTLVNTLASRAQFKPLDTELVALAAAIARNHSLPRLTKRIYLDITGTCCNDLRTGIERVARALTLALLEAPPEGYRIEPVYLSHENETWCYRHARRYTLGLMGCVTDGLEDEIVDPEVGDVLLGLDLSGDMLVQAEQSGLFQDYRNSGVSVYATVFDLLPLRLPAVFPPGADRIHQKWLEAISKFDGAVCISKAVADDLRAWQDGERLAWENRRPYSIGWFYLGADVASSAPTRGLPPNAGETLGKLKTKPSFLMVGTIEPRKGYMEALDAFEHLWRKGVDVNLIIVGHEGWKDLPDDMRRDIPQTIERFRNHPELNKRLFWLDGISDEYLEKVYAASECLIAASYGEGFGLPLIEAAQHKLSIIARDIPVFREVAGEHAYYFDASDRDGLSNAVKEWTARRAGGDRPQPQWILEIMSWKTSAKRLMDLAIHGRWPYRQVSRQIRKKAMDEHLSLIHEGRVRMVSILLPQGDVILDLGGANCPLYKMGYPHKFKKLYLIDLPPEARCEMYKEIVIDRNCDCGEVAIRYGDMTELHEFADSSVDFVWSGQSIEHVPLDAGRRMCQAAYRVLKPGGAFCLDTPNRLITRIHTRDAGSGFIHPEHCIEYEPAQLRGLLEEAGFLVQALLGICEMPSTAWGGAFDYTDFLYGQQITEKVEQSYIQYFHCLKI